MKTYQIGMFMRSQGIIDYNALADFLLWLSQHAEGFHKIADGYVAVTFDRDEDATAFYLMFSEKLSL